jgi:hypothetical protein
MPSFAASKTPSHIDRPDIAFGFCEAIVGRIVPEGPHAAASDNDLGVAPAEME